MAASTAAASRTGRQTTCRAAAPAQDPPPGDIVVRHRLGFTPTSPHIDAAIRIEPPPSPAWPIAQIPAATAAAEPPDEPPGERAVSHGLWVGPYDAGSVVGWRPSSGVFVRPSTTNPAARNRRVSSVSSDAT